MIQKAYDPIGLSVCSVYAYPPNSLHYCGPEKQHNLISYIKESTVDIGLAEIIQNFETLYPYLKLIAGSNNIKDPFDRRVVEAYWIGNKLLSNITKNVLYNHLTVQFKRKLPIQPRKSIENFTENGFPYHTFHVFNIFRRTGHVSSPQTLETMDACRISWGTVIKQQDFGIYQVSVQPLIIFGHIIKLGKVITKNYKSTGAVYQKGDLVSLHWGNLCQKLNKTQLNSLKNFTGYAIKILNKNL